MGENVIQDVAKDAGNISGTMIVLIVFCVGWLIERIYKVTSSRKTGLPTWKDLHTKVSKTDCCDFRTRIGRESSEHYTHHEQVCADITEIKEGIGYLKGKAE